MPRGQYDRTKFRKKPVATPPSAEGSGGLIAPPISKVPEFEFYFIARNRTGRVDFIEEEIYAHDLRGIGCLIRTVYYKQDGTVLNVCMTFVPGVRVLEGKLVRSME